MDTLRASEDHFVDYPEPPEEVKHGVPEDYPKDPYMEGLDDFVNKLSEYIRDFQAEEGKKLTSSAEKLKTQKGREEGEDAEKKEYIAGVTAIRKRRKHYRQLLKDALHERQKFFDSMIQQKAEQELVRKKLEQVKAPSNEHPSIRENTVFDYFSGFIILYQIAIALVYLVTIRFSDNPLQNHVGGPYRADDYFSYLTHIVLLTVFGFGFLLVFFRKYAFGGVGLNFLLTAFVSQLAILLNLLWKNIDQRERSGWERLDIDIIDIIKAVYAGTTVSVTFGALAGKVSHVEILLIAFSETFFYTLNHYLTILKVQAVDPGGAMTIHLFGAYFGLAVSYWISKPFDKNQLQVFKHENNSTYYSHFLTLVGTVFTFSLIPSFNAATAPDGSQHRVTVNTFVAMVGGVVFAFIVSKALRKRHFHIVDIQYATLAAGIAMASGHSAWITPGASLMIGGIVGFSSVVFFVFLQPYLEKRFPFKVFDSRGVHNVHGIPGLVGGFASIIALANGGKAVFGQPTTSIFPRNLPDQGGFQAACLFISLAISLSAGFFTGLGIYLLRKFLQQKTPPLFQDETEWTTPSDYPRAPFDLIATDVDAI